LKKSIIGEKSKNFAIKIIKLYKILADTKHEYVLSKQILKSGTSIGANIAESEHAQSKADFISKLYIALKESNETKYWITLLFRAEYLTDVEFESVMKDLRIIIGTLVNTIKKTKENQQE
jgi:four helix bundle protein